MIFDKKKNTAWGEILGIRPIKQIRQIIEENRDPVAYLEDKNVNPEKIKLAVEIARRSVKIINEQSKDFVDLYISIPFCPSKCLYCSFTSTPFSRARRLADRYLELLAAEISCLKDFQIENIYIGGGTPSVLEEYQIESLLYNIFNTLNLSNLKEFTFECGRADTVTKPKLKILKNYKVNRICINPQTMNDKTLAVIGRLHTKQDFYSALNLALDTGFSNINADIIAGLPKEGLDDYKYTLDELSKVELKSITVHTMYLKRASELKQNLDRYLFPSIDTVSKMISYSYDFMLKNDMFPYYMYKQKNTIGNLENTGYSKLGFECIYNINMIEEARTVLGAGAGAVTRLLEGGKIRRIPNIKDMEEYTKSFDKIIERKKVLI